MQSQEKNDLLNLASKFKSDVLLKYVARADPNEMGKRNLLEIVMHNLSCAYTNDESDKLNDALSIMIDNGLDTSRQVELLRYSDFLDAPSLLQAASNLENIRPSIFNAILNKEVANLAHHPNSGQNLMIGRIQNGDPDGFNQLLNHKVKLTPELAEEALRVLTAICSDADDMVTKEKYTEIGKSLVMMGPNLFNVRMFNDTQAFEDVISEKGYERFAALIKEIKIECDINQQKVIEVEDADAIYDNTFSRGL